jgi:hypothetical protein
MRKIIEALDTIANAQALNDAMLMAISGLDHSEDRNALQALGQYLADQIREARTLIERYRNAEMSPTQCEAQLATEPDTRTTDNADQWLEGVT